MTNADKFKEVFGFWPDFRMDEAVCNVMLCGDILCKDCRYCDEDECHGCWGDEYKEEK